MTPPPVLCRHCNSTLILRGARWVGPDGAQACGDQDDWPHQPMPHGLAGAPDPAVTIKYLTLWQPWAWLVAAGYKDVENRGQLYRAPGLVGIHAGQRLDRDALELPLVRAAIDNWLGNGYVLGVPPWQQGGSVVAVADTFTGHLHGCLPAAGCFGGRTCSPWAVDAAGTWHHTLGGTVRIDPVPARGLQQLWTPQDPGITREVLARRDTALHT